MQLPTIRLRRSPGAAWIVLDRAVALNAINVTMVADLNQVLDALEAEPALRAVVLTGSGASFCAGADLKESRERATRGRHRRERAVPRIGTTPDRSDRRFPATGHRRGQRHRGRRRARTHACVRPGHCSALREYWRRACELRAAPGGGGSARLPRRIGVQRAKYLMYTGQFVPAQTLCDWGLLIAVAEDGSSETQTSELVERLSGKSPLGLARMKQLVDDGLEQSLTAALRTEQTTSALHAHSFDRSEGLAAFAEKKPPRFEGR